PWGGGGGGVGEVGALRRLPEVGKHLLRRAAVVARERNGFERPRLDEVAGDRQRRGGDLPLRLGRQAAARPAREGVGLEVAHVAERRVEVERSHPGEREALPAAVAALPVERRAPAVLLNAAQPLREPERGA